MGAMASQITSIAIVYSTIYSGAVQRKHQISASLTFVRGVYGEFPAQRASNAENVSIWWRHQENSSTTLVILVSRNDRIYKYMCIFPKLNSI